MLSTVVANPVLGALLDGSLPENVKGSPWAVIFPLLGLLLLGGSVWLVLTTNVGAKRAIQLTVGAFLVYLFMHSLTWILSGTGYKLAPTGYWQTRLFSFGLGLGCFIFAGILFYVWHMNERAKQRVDEED